LTKQESRCVLHWSIHTCQMH